MPGAPGMGPMGPTPGVQPAAPPGPRLLAMAKQAFAEGREKQAMNCLWADAAVRADGKVLGKLRWLPVLRRPAMTTRWGLAMQASGPPDVLASVMGSAMQGMNMPGGAPGGMPMPMEAGPMPPPGMGVPGGAPGGAGQSVQSLWGRDTLERLKNLRGSNIEDLFDSLPDVPVPGQQPGGFGPMPMVVEGPGAMPPGMAMPGPMGGPNMGGNRLPGVTMLGAVTDLDHACQLATKEAVDLVMLVHLAGKPVRTRTGQAQTQVTATLKVIDPASGKELKSFAPVNDAAIQAALRPGSRVKNPLDKVLETLEQFLDTQVKLTEMPAISAEVAKNRAQSLAARQLDNPLPSLMELRYYEWKGLLKAEDLSKYYGQILDPDSGAKLATGAEAEREQVVMPWLSARR